MTKRGGRESGKGSTDEGHPEPRRAVSPMAAANLAACIHYWREGEPCPQCASESRIRALEAELAGRDKVLATYRRWAMDAERAERDALKILALKYIVAENRAEKAEAEVKRRGEPVEREGGSAERAEANLEKARAEVKQLKARVEFWKAGIRNAPGVTPEIFLEAELMESFFVPLLIDDREPVEREGGT